MAMQYLLPGLNILPANKNRVIYFLPDIAVNGLTLLIAVVNMLDRTVALRPVPEGHDREKLVIALAVGVHDRMFVSAAKLAR